MKESQGKNENSELNEFMILAKLKFTKNKK